MMNRCLICVCVSLVSVAPVSGQATSAAPSSAAHRTVALASDTCPLVHPGDVVTLDWNPGFVPAWPIHDLGAFGFRLRQKAWAMQGRLSPVLLLAPPRPIAPVSPGANGFFHMEMAPYGDLPPSGDYYVESMDVHPHLAADFQGSAPGMTNSPADGRLCVHFEIRGHLPAASKNTAAGN